MWHECLPELKGIGLGTLGMEGWPGAEAVGADLAIPKCCSKAGPPSLAATGMRPTAAASCTPVTPLISFPLRSTQKGQGKIAVDNERVCSRSQAESTVIWRDTVPGSVVDCRRVAGCARS